MGSRTSPRWRHHRPALRRRRGRRRRRIEKIAKNLAKGVELGKVSAADRDAALGRIRAFDELAAACTGADCVIEAVPSGSSSSARSSARSIRPRRARAARDQHVVAADRGDRGERPRTGSARRHALLQPRARDEARRGRPSRELGSGEHRHSGRARRAVRQDADHRERCAGFASSRLGLVIGSRRCAWSSRASRRPRTSTPR